MDDSDRRPDDFVGRSQVGCDEEGFCSASFSSEVRSKLFSVKKISTKIDRSCFFFK